ncbi:MAG: hypothetical protein AB3N63_17185 [Puniceicoccaceae bacterium]
MGWLNRYSSSGFVLPVAMVFTVAILVLASTSLEMGLYKHGIHHTAHLDQRARSQLKEALPGLIHLLEEQVLQPSASSAFLLSSVNTVHQVAFHESVTLPIPLYSESHDTDPATALFSSPISNIQLLANYRRLSPDSSLPLVELAWTAEDISLGETLVPPPDGWPLPDWNHSPVQHQQKPAQVPDWIKATAPAYNSWIPATEALPFSPDLSPDLVPVVTSLSLRFGIFASGTSGNREKIVRIRYYLEGTIWNPYNRDLRMHSAESLQPAFTLAWQNLPEVRIRNLSKGIQSGWISLDEVENSRTGATGLSGWIRTPGKLSPGEQYSFSEPDVKYQPEGLARTLHPSFMVGPADAIILEFRSNGAGSTAACLPLSEPNPVKAVGDGKGWFSFHGFPIDLASIEFDRADDPPTPFYLHGGSLDFRQEHCQYVIHLSRPESRLEAPTDPRRKQLSTHNIHKDAEGTTLQEKNLFKSVSSTVDSFTETPVTPFRTPLFSWPDRPPVSIIEYTDYTSWHQAFRLGSPGAGEINAILDDPAILPVIGSKSLTELKSASGSSHFFEIAFPVNHVSAEGWSELLRQSHATGQSVFNRYPTTDSSNRDHFHELSSTEQSSMTNSIQQAILIQPSRSVSDFFNRGLMTKSLSSNLDELLPLRGYLRQSDPIRPHGPAWILHLSVRVKDDQLSITRQARAWLQEILDDSPKRSFRVIRFEWLRD